MKNKNGLHNRIKSACEKAAPAILQASKGSEASIYNLRFAVADLMEILLEDGSVVDALKYKGIVIIKNLEVEKYA